MCGPRERTSHKWQVRWKKKNNIIVGTSITPETTLFADYTHLSIRAHNALLCYSATARNNFGIAHVNYMNVNAVFYLWSGFFFIVDEFIFRLGK